MPSVSFVLRHRPGFNLVELLVVIAIIGVLVALLLPAVQQAREVANRARCNNNLHQLGVALHSYHETYGMLPIGARSQQKGTGISWFVGILPYVDQGNLYNDFDMVGPHNGSPSLPPPTGSRNGTVLNNKRVPAFWCPSSPLPEMAAAAGGLQFQMSCYFGISGATPDAGFTTTRVTICCSGATDAYISAEGMLVPNQAIRLSDATDGTSNVLMVGEGSNYGRNLYGGATNRIDAAFSMGWAAGTAANGAPPNYVPSTGTIATPAYNIMTTRYSPNAYYSILTTLAPQSGIGSNRGPNNPMSSAHPGGVSGLMVDGAVRFISENIALETLKQICVRDDKARVSDF